MSTSVFSGYWLAITTSWLNLGIQLTPDRDNFDVIVLLSNIE